ncbi:uncharacterized protein LOC110966087 isoform X2 [Acanthochromis polyacanthus]|uniref:uncharacterized protein LOC110966087 isoform X2 n=1 Tax=Acanthochromis polyacanthus TaxID=80966 RepID=UPI002234CFC4|nr:uncharacterized protein LOC110966087 isoform X2 [Acanthochromis polyacanthus]
MRPAPHHSGYLGIINFQLVAPCNRRPHTGPVGDYPECRWSEDRPEKEGGRGGRTAFRRRRRRSLEQEDSAPCSEAPPPQRKKT